MLSSVTACGPPTAPDPDGHCIPPNSHLTAEGHATDGISASAPTQAGQSIVSSPSGAQAVTLDTSGANTQSIPAGYRVFLSHSRHDRWIATQIRARLQAEGITVFLDVFDIRVGDEFRKKIITELRECDELLVLLTPSSIKRAWIPAEIGIAVDRRKPVVGIRYSVEMEELYESGLASLICDSFIILLDDLESYVTAVVRRAGAHERG